MSRNRTPRRRRRTLFLAAVVLTVAVGTTIGLALTDRSDVPSHEGLASVSYGVPATWLTQDLSALDPPVYPASYRFTDPWYFPTGIRLGAALLDATLFAAAATVLVATAARCTRRRVVQSVS